MSEDLSAKQIEHLKRSDVICKGCIIIQGILIILMIVGISVFKSKFKDVSTQLESWSTNVNLLKASAIETIPFTGTSDTIDDSAKQAEEIQGSTEFILEYYDSFDNSPSINVDVSKIVGFAITGDNEIAANKAEYQKKLEEERKRKEEELAKQKSANVAAEMQRRGNIGRLVCPSVGIDVALFASSSQSVVDAADSACYFGLGGSMVIGDHWNQGFTRIKSLSPGSQIYIDRGTSKSYYTVQGVYQATNTGYDLVSSSGTSLSGTASLLLYTCNGADWHNVTVVACN